MDEGRERSEEERPGAPAPGDAPPRDGDSPEAESARGSGTEDSSVTPLAGRIGWMRTVEVDGVRRPVASLLRRGTALAIDICFALLAAGIAIDVLAYFVPVDTAAASGFMLPIFGFLAVYIVWLRDRGASRPGGGFRFGLSVGRWLLGLRLVPVAGPRRLIRPVTVADSERTEGETMRIVRAVLVGVMASLVALLLLGHAVSRTVVFLTVRDHAERHPPLAAERGSDPELASFPSSLIVGRSRAYVQVDAEWGDRGDPLDFFLVRDGGGWKVAEVRVGRSAWFRANPYLLDAQDADVPAP